MNTVKAGLFHPKALATGGILVRAKRVLKVDLLPLPHYLPLLSHNLLVIFYLAFSFNVLICGLIPGVDARS